MPAEHDGNRTLIEARIRREGRRPVDAGLFGDYHFTVLLGLALALAGFLVLAHLPWADPGGDIGWRPGQSSNPTIFQIVPRQTVREELEAFASEGSPVPVTTFSSQEPETEASTADDVVEVETVDTSPGEDRTETRRVAEMSRLQVLEFAEEQPGILGGLNALYMNIRYPKAARDAGIQGQVLLQFIVELDGRANDIQVVKSLHPLCDNAAIEAVKMTRFQPARQNGRQVRVRMSLPIRFVLIDESTGNVVRRDTQATRPSMPG